MAPQHGDVQAAIHSIQQHQGNVNGVQYYNVGEMQDTRRGYVGIMCELLYANKLLLSREFEFEFEWFNGVCGVYLKLFYVEGSKQVIGGLVETIII